MSGVLQRVNGVPVLVCPADGPSVASEQDALDLIGAAFGQDARWVALPVSRLADEFFQLRTGLAGAITQKFVNYRLSLAIVGDISRHTETSGALRDFVRESNNGTHLWFLPDLAALVTRLGG